jgi:hypothetical protein
LLNETDPHKVAVVILQLHDGNLWWLRDDKGKDFFKWWRENRGVSQHNIYALIHTSYQREYKYLTRSSDGRILRELRNKFPSGRLINLGRFWAFIVKPTAGSV